MDLTGLSNYEAPINFDEEIKLKIFEPRFTTKSSGMGLGLSIISNIIKSFGGTIEFETKMNIGTTFTITLPKN